MPGSYSMYLAAAGLHVSDSVLANSEAVERTGGKNKRDKQKSVNRTIAVSCGEAHSDLQRERCAWSPSRSGVNPTVAVKPARI